MLGKSGTGSLKPSDVVKIPSNPAKASRRARLKFMKGQKTAWWAARQKSPLRFMGSSRTK